jgi:Ulp1 family protease
LIFILISTFFGTNTIFTFPSTLFVNFTQKSSLKLKISTREKISKHKFLILPTLFNNHWRVVISDSSKRVISIYDSLNYFEPENLELVHSMLCIIYDLERSLLSKNWCIKHIYKPSQNNSYDCGAFICLFVRFFFLNSSSFSQNLVTDFRAHILKELMAAELFIFDSLDSDFPKKTS